MNLIDPNTPLDQFLLTAPELEPLFVRLGMHRSGDGIRSTESLSEFCERRGLDWQTTRRMLAALQAPRQRAVPALELMTLTELCDHLEQTQTSRLHVELARVEQLVLGALAQGETTQRQFRRFQQTFNRFRRQLIVHLRKEAAELYPLLRRCSTARNGERPTRSLLKTRVTRMESDHEQAEAMLGELTEIARDDAFQSSAATAAGAMTQGLAALDRVVQEQIYAENHVLFPRVLGMSMVM